MSEMEMEIELNKIPTKPSFHSQKHQMEMEDYETFTDYVNLFISTRNNDMYGTTKMTTYFLPGSAQFMIRFTNGGSFVEFDLKVFVQYVLPLVLKAMDEFKQIPETLAKKHAIIDNNNDVEFALEGNKTWVRFARRTAFGLSADRVVFAPSSFSLLHDSFENIFFSN